MIYFIQSGKDGPIKIGYTRDRDALKIRMYNFQVGSPERLTLLLAIEGSENDESSIQRKFYPYHILGEWFEPNKNIVEFINKKNVQKSKPINQLLEETVVDLPEKDIEEYLAEVNEFVTQNHSWGKNGRPKKPNKRIQYNVRLLPQTLEKLRKHNKPASQIIESGINLYMELDGLNNSAQKYSRCELDFKNKSSLSKNSFINKSSLSKNSFINKCGMRKDVFICEFCGNQFDVIWSDKFPGNDIKCPSIIQGNEVCGSTDVCIKQ